jgi:hypothetical protein
MQLNIINDMMACKVLSVTSLEWLRQTRFYHSHQQTYMSVGDVRYEYAFNYLDKPELLFIDQQMFGRCLIGQKAYGKTSRITNLAQLLSLQPRLIRPNDSYDRIEIILKGCIGSDVWLIIQHITSLSSDKILLIYHYLMTSQVNKQAKGFEYFLTLN